MAAGPLRAPRGRARRRVLALLALATLAIHGVVVDRLSAAMDTGLGATPERPRLQAAFVRELQLDESRPAPVAVPTPSPPRPAVRPAAPEAPEPEASAAVPDPPASAADPPPPLPPPEPALPAPDAELPPAGDAASDAAAAAASEPAVPPSAAASATAPPFDWPLGTRLRYALTGYVRGEVYGQAQVEWLREGSRYQVHLDVVVGPSFAPAMQRRMTSDGEITEHGLAPRRYDERTQIGFAAARELQMHFDPPDIAGNPGAVTLANGRRLPGLPGVQDTASQFVQLTWLFATGRQALQAGTVVELPVALPRRLDRWVYEVVGEDVLHTDAGPVRAWHLRPRTPADAGTLTVESWFAPGLQYLPVRILIRNGPEDFLDLLIDRLPQQAEPAPDATVPSTPERQETER